MNGVPDNPEQLLRERAWLGALARQLVRAGEAADEVADDAMSAAVTQPLPASSSPRGWLAAILRKQLAGRRRADLRRQLREQLASRPEAVPPAADTVLQFELQRDVANAVLGLAEPYRTTVLLRFWEGLRPAAIGRRMHVPVETVRTRLKRGLMMLRERLARLRGNEVRAWLLPLWLLGRRSGSVAMSWMMGVSLMTGLQKLLVGGAALAAALLLWVAEPWARASTPAALAEGLAPAPIAAAVEPGGAAAVAGEAAGVVERIAVVPGQPAAWLSVKGRLVDDETGVPVAGLPVRLVCWPRGDEPDVETASGADGSFALADARPKGARARDVLVQSPQYALAHVHANYAWDRDGDQTIDVGTIRLARGTLYAGQVVDQDGRGVAGARLLLPMVSPGYGGYDPQHMFERFLVVGSGDPDGRFRLALPIGPGVDHRNLLFAVTPSGLGWCRIEPSKGRREITDLVLRLRPSGALRVAVQDPAGQPAAGVLVRALPRFGPIGIEQGGFRDEVSDDELVRARFRGRTDDHGELLLPDLPTGEPDPMGDGRHDQCHYELWVEAADFPEQPLCGVDLQPGGEVRVAVHLLAARRIAVTATVRDDLGAAIADAVVTCLTEKDLAVSTGASGRATLSAEAVQKLGFRASCDGYRSAGQWLEPGADATTLQVAFVLARVRPLDGRVVDQFGAGVAGMNLFVDDRMVGVTDAEGRFHLAEFPMGERRLMMALASSMDLTRWTGEQSPQTVDVERGPVTLVMQRRLGSVDVKVVLVDAASGEALEPTRHNLALRDEASGSYVLRHEAQVARGLITCTDMPAGSWRLDVVTATGQRGSLPFTLTDGQPPTDLRLELQAPGSVTGRLQFVDVAPPAEVTLDVRHATVDPKSFVRFRYPGSWHVDPSSQRVADNQFGGTGTLRLSPLQSPTFRLDSADSTDDLVFTVRGPGYAGEARVRVPAGGVRNVVLEVRAAGVPR